MFQVVYDNIGQIILMLSLLFGSAFFSASETAFFRLSRHQKRLLEHSTHRLCRFTATLLKNPSRLLNCFLFGNTIVNVLYFAVSSILITRIKNSSGISAAGVAGFISFSMVVLFGEIVPKSLAFSNAKSISLAATVPVAFFLRIFAPVLFVFRYFILEPALRLTIGPAGKPARISIDEFKTLIDITKKQGQITHDENRLLTEIVELGLLKVRHVMKPRVDMAVCDVTEPVSVAVGRMNRNNLTKIPVHRGNVDKIIGQVYLRHILLNPSQSLDKLVVPIHFVPEQKTVESLLQFFRKAGTDIAIVVDEYGGIAGSVTIEDIVEEITGQAELAGAEQQPPVEQIGPFKYRLAGDLAIHNWAEVFGIDPAQCKASTIAGLVTTIAGKIPREGESVYLRNLKFLVEKMDKHRIKSIIFSLEQIESDNGR